MLENSFIKLNNEKSFNVAFFGGSITEGAGASCYEKSWAGRFTAWLDEKFPNCRINGIQASIGGTSSSLGVFRCDKDVLSKDPDLVFIEFAVNDHGTDNDIVINNNESILRKIHAHNPNADVIFVYTTTQGIADDIKEGVAFESKNSTITVAKHYSVMDIDIGQALIDEVAANCGAWKDYLGDSVHPTDKGHELYFEAVRKHVEQAFESCNTPDLRKKCLPDPIITNGSFENARLVAATEATYDSRWHIQNIDPKNKAANDYTKQEKYLKSDTPGAELAFEFVGTRIGIFWAMDNYSGKLDYSVDGGEIGTASAWDFYCPKFSRENFIILADNLEKGPHKLNIKISGDKKEGSLGHTIRIGYFMVC